VVLWAALALTSLGAGAQTTTTAPPTPSTTGTTAPTTATTAATTATTAAETTSTTGAATTEPASPTVVTTGDPSTSTTLSAEQRRERDRAVANLNLARANDREIAAQLRLITEEANETVEKVEEAERRLQQAKQVAERSAAALEQSGSKQAEIEASLALQAVEGYKTRSIGPVDMLLSDASVNEAIRQNQLLDQANTSTADLLEELRGLLEDRRLANAEAELATVEAEEAQAELEAQLEKLQEQQSAQIGLKAEAERRIDAWAGELTAYAREDAAVQSVIGRSAAPVNTAVAAPTNPSALGFQWPIQAPITSPYGYRVHPVYGSRRLHAGVDLGAARGTQIASSNDGSVIFAGVQGGYGNTVIVDHGGGITTLYAHLTSFNVSKGQTVGRGDIVGFVGSTGTATGPHLHFEVRVNGGPVNPISYLP
jgi:murein DD-endopeptidase MepM/ murein hydrolase activator NlpD